MPVVSRCQTLGSVVWVSCAVLVVIGTGGVSSVAVSDGWSNCAGLIVAAKHTSVNRRVHLRRVVLLEVTYMLCPWEAPRREGVAAAPSCLFRLVADGVASGCADAFRFDSVRGGFRVCDLSLWNGKRWW